MSPTVAVKINGVPTRMVADSGAFYSLISLSVARQFKLRLSEAPEGLRLSGIGNDSSGVSVATVSRVFNLPDKVAPETRALVEQAAAAAAALMSGTAFAGNIGVSMANSDTFLTVLRKGIETSAKAAKKS